MATLPKLAAALTAQDPRLADVLRLSVIEGLSLRAIAQRLQRSCKTVRTFSGAPPSASRARASHAHRCAR
jgi:DNA-directed RNA polymerase specialized sigma24 family protein